MQNFEEYAEKAIARCKLNSYNQLAKALEITQPAIVSLRKKKTLPSARTMIKIAKLAGVPEEQALLDLATWANADKPEIAEIYRRIAKMICCAVFICLFLWSFNASASIPETSENVYYVAQIFSILLILRIFQNLNCFLIPQIYDFARYFGGLKNDSAY